MAEPLNYFDVQQSSAGGIVGPRLLAPLVAHPTYGYVLVDQTDGKFWALVVVSGVLKIQQVTM